MKVTLSKILTDRQVEIFMLIMQGYSPAKIAKKGNVSLQNVLKVLHKVYAKLEAGNAVEAIGICLRHGLLSAKDIKRKETRA